MIERELRAWEPWGDMGQMGSSLKRVWTCPRCGRSLRIANQEHVCGLADLDGHFERRDPLGWVAFQWMSDHLASLGPFDVLPMKTMIAFANGVNFALLKTKRSGAEVSFVLTETPAESRVAGTVTYSRTKRIVRVPICDETELDAELEAWLSQAYGLTSADR